MIEGLKIRMTSEELAEKLTERIVWHEATAREYDKELRTPGRVREIDDMPEQMIAHEMRDHRARVGILTLVRDHLLPGEIYLLTERDLEFADLVPEFNLEFIMPSRPQVTN